MTAMQLLATESDFADRRQRSLAMRGFERPDHLFVVEGDVVFRDRLCRYLEEQGVASTPMASAEEMLQRIHRLRPDLIVLNARLPKMSGLDVCGRTATRCPSSSSPLATRRSTGCSAWRWAPTTA